MDFHDFHDFHGFMEYGFSRFLEKEQYGFSRSNVVGYAFSKNWCRVWCTFLEIWFKIRCTLSKNWNSHYLSLPMVSYL